MNLPANVLLAILVVSQGHPAEPPGWPAELKGASNGTVTLRSELFLKVPDAVQAAMTDAKAVAFRVAKTPPTVDLAFHRDLGPDSANRRLWSSWGDICVASDGSVYCGIGGIWSYETNSRQFKKTDSAFPDSPGMRSSTAESSAGFIYGTTHQSNQLFQYCPDKDELDLLGPTWLAGEYTTVTVLSPDERFLCYVPGAHGRAFGYGTPVIQYEIASGQRKVIAFLAEAFEKEYSIGVPGRDFVLLGDIVAHVVKSELRRSGLAGVVDEFVVERQVEEERPVLVPRDELDRLFGAALH